MHIVTFSSAEGKPGFHQTDSLEEAVKFVEHLTNSESVSDAKVYRMTEVPLEVKAVYRVEVAGSAATPTDGSIRDVPFPAA